MKKTLLLLLITVLFISCSQEPKKVLSDPDNIAYSNSVNFKDGLEYATGVVRLSGTTGIIGVWYVESSKAYNPWNTKVTISPNGDFLYEHNKHTTGQDEYTKYTGTISLQVIDGYFHGRITNIIYYRYINKHLEDTWKVNDDSFYYNINGDTLMHNSPYLP